MKRSDVLINKEIGNLYMAEAVNKNNRKWFVFVSAFLLLWVSAYFYMHWLNPGYAFTKFTTAQIQQVSRILYHDPQSAMAPLPVASPVTDNDTIILPGSAKNDTIIASSQVPIIQQRSEICDDSCKVNKAVIYIREVFDNNIKEDQLDVMHQYLSSFSSQEVGLFLADAKVKIKSYFWLTGPAVYLEIIFWVIIGVACSILFSLGNANRNTKNPEALFSSRDIPYQIAKLFYAPFSTIILVLTYNYIKHRNVIEVNTNEGMLVFSFMAGLFSGRVMSLLERFKDVLLPEYTTTAPNVPAADFTLTQQGNMGALLAPKYLPKQKPDASGYQPAMPSTGSVKPAAQLDEVIIELKLDNIGLFDEEKNEILNTNFSNAIVTLHKINAKELIPATYKHEQGRAIFIAEFLEAGIYIIRCTIVHQFNDKKMLNLFGEKTIYINAENNHIELTIKKFESLE